MLRKMVRRGRFENLLMKTMDKSKKASGNDDDNEINCGWNSVKLLIDAPVVSIKYSKDLGLLDTER